MTDHAKLQDKGVQVKYKPIFNEFGFTKGSLRSDQKEDARTWTVGMNPIIFPYLLAFGPEEGDGRIRRSYQIGVPIDDTHTWHIQYFCYVFPNEVDVPAQNAVPYAEMPLKDENGEYILDYVLAQDIVAWAEQGEITDRSEEHLGSSDMLVMAYRKMLKEQIDTVAQGGEPMNVFRDPGKAESPELRIPGNEGPAPVRDTMYGAAVSYRENYHKPSKAGWLYIDDDADRCCPDRDLIVELFQKAEEVRTRQAEKV